MVKFLEPGDPGSFDDFPLETKRDWMNDNYGVCPRCQGHGGWNLSINSYPLFDLEDTPENRHRRAHFKAHCTQCHGYGYTTDFSCVHEMYLSKNVGRCLNEYVCSKCNHKAVWDSGD